MQIRHHWMHDAEPMINVKRGVYHAGRAMLGNHALLSRTVHRREPDGLRMRRLGVSERRNCSEMHSCNADGP
jgi:hypothetical protein